MTERTPEQRAADDDLDRAIKRVHAAYADITAAWMITEHIVIYCVQGVDEDNDESSAVLTMVDGSLPVHRLLGLCEWAAARYRSLANHNE